MFSLKESLDLVESRTSRANGHWNFFWGVTLAALGYIKIQNEIGPQFKGVLTLILCSAYFFNLLALLRVQKEMRLFNQEVKRNLEQTQQPSGQLDDYLKARSFDWYSPVTIVIHLVGDAIVILMLWIHK
jgi:hypothetical protein